MKKFESLNQSKFERFEKNAVANLSKVVGGKDNYPTTQLKGDIASDSYYLNAQSQNVFGMDKISYTA